MCEGRSKGSMLAINPQVDGSEGRRGTCLISLVAADAVLARCRSAQLLQ
jgi:hypothetical protein